MTVVRDPNAPFDEADYKALTKMKQCARDWITLNHAKDNYLNMMNEKKYAPNNDWFLAGGFFSSIFHDETPVDMDIFICNSTEQSGPTSPAWSKMDVPRTASWQTAGNPHIKNVFEYRGTQAFVNGIPQLIITDHPDRLAAISDFDYLHTMISYSLSRDLLFCSKATLNAIRYKTLVLINSTYTTPARKKKYEDRGYKE